MQEFLGTMSYDVAGTPKIVQFWRMQALDGPARKPARDVRAVQWLPLDQAVKKLTHAREQVFLANVGPVALKGRRTIAPDMTQSRHSAPERPTLLARVRAWLQPEASAGGAKAPPQRRRS